MQDKLSKIRPEVQWFANRMEKKLAKNEYKTHWKYLTFEALILKMDIEFSELKIAWKECIENSQMGDKVTIEALINECIDVANYAMMLTDKFNDIVGKREADRERRERAERERAEVERIKELAKIDKKMLENWEKLNKERGKRYINNGQKRFLKP